MLTPQKLATLTLSNLRNFMTPKESSKPAPQKRIEPAPIVQKQAAPRRSTQSLADLTPSDLDKQVAANEATSPLVPFLEDEIVTMIKEGHWDTFPVRLMIVSKYEGQDTVYLRLGRRLSQQPNSEQLMRYYNTFNAFAYGGPFPEFVARVAKLKLPDTLKFRVTPSSWDNPPFLIIEKA